MVQASLTVGLVELGQQGSGDYCFDIVVTVEDDFGGMADDWTAATGK